MHTWSGLRTAATSSKDGMAPYAFLSITLWPLICCGDECQFGIACTGASVLLAVISFVVAQLVRELWLLRILRGYQ